MGRERRTNRTAQTIRNVEDERSAYRELEQDTFLVDGGKQILKCSACGKDLATIWIVKENLPIKSFVRVLCPYCEDHSYIAEVKGKFLIGHIEGLTMVDNTMESMDEEDGVIIQRVLIKTVIGD